MALTSGVSLPLTPKLCSRTPSLGLVLVSFVCPSSLTYPVNHSMSTHLKPTVLARVSVAVVKHHNQKQLGEGMFPLVVCSPASQEVRVGTPGINLEAGADAEASVEACYILACSSWFAQRDFL